MGLALADVNADGRLDISRRTSPTTSRPSIGTCGRGLFEDVALPAGLGVQNRFVQWGVGLPDLDNDGWMDAFYVTGNVYPEIEAALPQYPHRSRGSSFAIAAADASSHMSASSGPGATAPQSSRGAAFGDIDNDGDIDALVMNMNAPPSLLLNDSASRRPLAGVRLRGRERTARGSGRHGASSRAADARRRAPCSAKPATTRSTICGSTFGLGAATRPIGLKCDGRRRRRRVTGVAANRVVTVRERSTVDIPAREVATSSA